ncbi:spermidine/putrescine transport system substrate-binding protein [Angulomicrobium tetraedrale]|uniref:Spermidine/putrescine transport system substrate-binding protein n=1 Tax=Ancylobacter tetraedralis TaxID=217068 RepID=A0A839ZFP7_9HYPH|nr:spermidine/putrescine ABC transporter substrate-binding protein [Ancylobacter tetraedralis]MBB3773415.1 spermidine/putrescine transport system substrate-binding protein [Ancylobacter tetraedralis]
MKTLRSSLTHGTMAVAIGALTLFTAVEARAESITVLNFANYMPEDILQRFKDKTGISVDLVTTSTNEETMGRLTTSNGAGFDVVFVSSPFAEALRHLDLVTDVNHANLPNLVNLYDEAKNLSFDPGNVYTVPYAWGTTGLCYRDDLLSKAPTSWWDLLKPSDEAKGKITMVSTDRWLLAAGQLANGYSVNDVTPEHLEKVKADLIAAKKTLLAYDDATFYSKLVAGEAVMVHAWDGWCNYALAETPHAHFVVPKEGSDFYIDVMVVPKASEHKEAAEKFINFVLEPENQGWVSTNLFFKTPNRIAMEALPEDIKKKYPNLTITPADLAKFETFHDLGADLPRVSKVVTEITSSR